MAPIVNGTIAAAVPIDEPTIKRVTGISATNRIINGIERPILTTMPKILFMVVFSNKPFFLLKCNSTPSGIPTAKPMKPEVNTITMVSHKESTNNSIKRVFSVHHVITALNDIT